MMPSWGFVGLFLRIKWERCDMTYVIFKYCFYHIIVTTYTDEAT